MKVTIIGDGLIKGETIKEAVIASGLAEASEIQLFSWYEDLSKKDFQEKMLAIEKAGPNDFPVDPRLLDALSETTYLFAHIAPISRPLIEHCQQLNVIGLCRGGTENIDLEACQSQGIPVIRMVKNAEATAEFTLGLMLALTRNIGEGNRQVKLGNWRKLYPNDGYRMSLSESKIGIIGLGHIGQLVAQKLIALGAEVDAYHPNLTAEKKAEVGPAVTYTTLADLMASCDIISLHMRLDNTTTGLIDDELLSLMKPTAYLVNTARAGLVDEQALIKVIKENRIAGAALDVAWQEPIAPHHPLLAQDNVLLTPHIAGDTDVIDRAPSMLMREVLHYLAGEPTQMLIKAKYMTNHWQGDRS